jgi:hypothetical protein
MKEMIEMSQTEVAYWVAFLKDINKQESSAAKPNSKGLRR